MLIEQHPDEGGAVSALMKIMATKTRRGYRVVVDRREQRVSGVPIAGAAIAANQDERKIKNIRTEGL
jgi:predicted DNA-binding WGR domain protein